MHGRNEEPSIGARRGQHPQEQVGHMGGHISGRASSDGLTEQVFMKHARYRVSWGRMSVLAGGPKLNVDDRIG